MGRARPRQLSGVRAGYLAQVAAIDDVVGALSAASFERSTRLGEWRVAELVAHIADGVALVARQVAEPTASAARLDAISYLAGMAAGASTADDRARLLAAEARPAELRQLSRSARRDVERALVDAMDGIVVESRQGPIDVAEHLATRCVEVSVHALDLTAATDVDVPTDRLATGTAVRLLASGLEAAAPGRSVELRIPPYAAVQCVEGPRHTRGTPPSVVECDPVTWLELATGRVGWEAARSLGLLRASGERADLSAWLPLVA